jgi:hypothetical protein
VAHGNARTSPIWEGEFDRTGRSWGFNYKLTGIGENFAARAGFVPRSDIVTAHAFNRVSFYGGRGRLVEQITVFGGPTRIWHYGRFPKNAIEGGESAEGSAYLRGGWRVNGHLSHDFVDFDPRDYTGYEVDGASGLTPYSPLSGVSDGFTANVGLTTPTYQGFDASVGVLRSRGPIFPEGARGYETRLTADLSLRPTGSVRVSLSGTFSRLTRDRAGSEFARTIIPRLKVEFQPNRSLFFRVVGEYVAQRTAALEDARTGDPLVVDGTRSVPEENNRMRVDWLVSFEPSPGTVAFFGYGASLDDTRAFGFRRVERTSDGFFVKVAYQLRK